MKFGKAEASNYGLHSCHPDSLAMIVKILLCLHASSACRLFSRSSWSCEATKVPSEKIHSDTRHLLLNDSLSRRTRALPERSCLPAGMALNISHNHYSVRLFYFTICQSRDEDFHIRYAFMFGTPRGRERHINPGTDSEWREPDRTLLGERTFNTSRFRTPNSPSSTV